MNTLYDGDNLTILRECIADESVALIYLDPTLNSHCSYNVLFRDESGRQAPARSSFKQAPKVPPEAPAQGTLW